MSPRISAKDVNLHIVDSEGFAPYAKDLRTLERSVTYPIDDGADEFFIDHGPDYYPFFAELGDPYFMVCEHEGKALGAVAGVFREARVFGELMGSAYLGDFKLARSVRGGALSRRVALRALRAAFLEPRFWRWRLGYFAAMRGKNGDVMRSMKSRKGHVGAINRPFAELAIFFEPPERLAELSLTNSPPPPMPNTGIDLSPNVLQRCQGAGWMTTAGRKDLRLVSTSEPWPLTHLAAGPDAWAPTFAHYVQRCGSELVASDPTTTTCFSLDLRLKDQLAWLAGQGIEPGATCGVYGLALLRPGRLGSAKWLHLATSEI